MITSFDNSIFFRICGLACRLTCPKRFLSGFKQLLLEFRAKPAKSYELVILDACHDRSGKVKFPSFYWSAKTARVAVENTSLRLASSVIGTFIARVLAENDGILVHGCLLKKNDKGYVFIGPSGAGKSTIARNASGFIEVSDDICAIRLVNGTWLAFGVPLLQNDGLPALPLSSELRNIFTIIKNRRNYVSEMNPQKSIEIFLNQVIIPFENMDARRKIFNTTLNLIEAQKPLRFFFRQDLDVSIFLK